MNVIPIIVIGGYVGLVVTTFLLRKRILKRLGTALVSEGGRIEEGSIFNPIGFHIKIIYNGKEFLISEVQAYDKPLSARVVYRGEIRVKVPNADFWGFRNKDLLKDLPDAGHYSFVGNYLVRRISPKDFKDLEERIKRLLDEMQEKVLMIEKAGAGC